MKYGVIYTEQVYHEGDERSRTNPGHGYPAYTEDVQKLQTFESEAELKSWIARQPKYKKFVAIRYEELSVKTEIVVELA